MAVDDVQIPAITTNLYDPVVTTQTAKEWYLYWHQSGDRINALNEMVTYGSSGDRLLASQVPYGALYVESDRSGVIYQNQGGAWHYIAGVMWGTLNPDQRPVGLGANDAGFTFRTTDTTPQNAGRQFIWSGTVWIETTPAKWDTHATRLALTIANLINGELFVEYDRSGVIYQNQGGVWHFLAGTMWGTISPDQRPTDLGANDAGFHFRGTDQAREFIWSGTAWVEVTPVTGAVNLTHANVVTRVGSTAGQIVEGGITDLSAADSGSLYISAAGSIGIGTQSPAAQLDVVGSNGMMISDSTGDHDAGIRYQIMRDGPTGYLGFTGTQATYSGYRFFVSGSVEVFRINNNGSLYVPSLPGANPGAGSKQLWYDPADANRVKYSP